MQYKLNEMEGLDLHFQEENVWKYNGTYGTELFTEKAKEIIKDHDPSEPLFLYVAQIAPHSGNFNTTPLQAPEKYVKPMVGIDDEKRRIFAGMVSALDYSTGEIFAALEYANMLDNTIFIFTTDNGAAGQDQYSSGSSWPLNGCKFTLWEGGVRGVAFIWSPSLRDRSNIYNELMHISDWLPTLLSAAGGQEALNMLPNNINGVDQWPSIARDLSSPRTEILLNLDDIAHYRSIRIGRYKIINGKYGEGIYDTRYDKEGKAYSGSIPELTPVQDTLYEENYMTFLNQSKAAAILQKKYGRDPILASTCLTPECKHFLEIKCGVPQFMEPVCDGGKESCLFDIINDPCEMHNIAKELPKLTAEMEQAFDKYRAIAIPSGEAPSDPAANPKYHNNSWIPWK